MDSIDCSPTNDITDSCSEAPLEIPRWAVDYAARHYDRQPVSEPVIEPTSGVVSAHTPEIHIVNNVRIIQGGSGSGCRVFYMDRDQGRPYRQQDSYDYYRRRDNQGDYQYQRPGCNQGQVYMPRDSYHYYQQRGGRILRPGGSCNQGRDYGDNYRFYDQGNYDPRTGRDTRDSYRYYDPGQYDPRTGRDYRNDNPSYRDGRGGYIQQQDGRPYRRPEPGWRQHVDGRYSDPFGLNRDNGSGRDDYYYQEQQRYYEEQQRRAYEEQVRRYYEQQRYELPQSDYQRYRDDFRNRNQGRDRFSNTGYENNLYSQRTRDMVYSMLGRSIRQYDPSIPERLGCARFVSVALNRATGLNIHDANVNGLERSLINNGFVAVPLSQARAGDVIIAKRGAGKHGHAAIYMGDGKIANNSSSSRVIKIDSVNKFNNRSYVSAVAYRPQFRG